MNKHKLSDEQKRFIVQALACFDSPSDVADAVKEEFGIEVSRQLVQTYDPTKHAGKDLAKKWIAVFHASREEFLASTAKIPIANRAFRLREMEGNYRRLKRQKNYVAANAVLEQAAKECGDVYTNKTKIDAKVATTARTVIVPAKGN